MNVTIDGDEDDNDIWQRLNLTSTFIRRQLENYARETVEHLIIIFLLYLLTCYVLYRTRWRYVRFERGINHHHHHHQQQQRILLVTAHPDDECMFFGPTIMALAERHALYLMCLSTGRNYGMGHRRRDELYAACHLLGIKQDRIIVHNHTALPDDLSVRWPPELIAKLISINVECYEINTIITFDRHGISGHPNHSAIYYAIAHLSLERHLPSYADVYVLESVNVLRKYWAWFDLPLAYLLSRTRYLAIKSQELVIYNAMKEHHSQFVWFRRLYMMFSRYTMINTLQKMAISDIELDLELDD